MSAPTRIARLAALAAGSERTILGLMSGTSLDGLDLALCHLQGQGQATGLELLHFISQPYTDTDKARLRKLAFCEQVSLRALTTAHGWLAERHAVMVLAALESWRIRAPEIDLLASHGQTVYHAPEHTGGARAVRGMEKQAEHTATLQIGDGDRLAVRTGMLTLSDFRQKEIAGGGQGAPLAPYAQALLFGGAQARILLNLGGIANFTWLPAADHPPRAHPLSSDTGPGNTLIDLAMRRRFAKALDAGGAVAAQGQVHAPLLAALKAHPYFAQPGPKSTGPEMFSEAYLTQAMEQTGTNGDADKTFPPVDLVATLTRLTAETIAETIAETLRREIPSLENTEIIVSGGGIHNATLLGWLRELLPELHWQPEAARGIPPDAMEAVLFAVLANESLWGAGFADQGGKGTQRMGFGKLSFPD